jgi:hypothetical protein
MMKVGEDDELEEDLMDYAAQQKGEERPQLVARKSVQMLTRAQSEEASGRRQKRKEEFALVAVDSYGGEVLGDGGVNLNVPKTVKEALEGEERVQWEEAIWEEIDSMEEAEVWGPPVTAPAGVVVTPLRFIFAKKVGAGGEMQRYKARLIFQNRDTDEGDECFYAPVVDKVSLRVFLAVVAQKGWLLEQADVKTAFLNAKNEGEDYVKLPGYVVRPGESPIRILQKALYGLRRAPKAWNSTFTEWVTSVGFKPTASDPCLFVHNSRPTMLVIYVDDLLVAAATEEDLEHVQGLMEERFRMRRMGVPQYFLGMDVDYEREQGRIHLCQKTYIGALMEKYGEYVVLQRSLPIQAGIILTKEQGEQLPTWKPYSSLVGALLFLAVSTRPDISFAVGVLSKFLKCPGEPHWEVAVGVLSYLSATRDRGVMLGDFGFGEQGKLIGFADADWANDIDDRKSISGGALFFGGGIVLWHSRKQQMVCTSTAEAEIHAVLEMVYAMKSVAMLVGEIFENFF